MDELALLRSTLTGPEAEPSAAAVERGRAALLEAAAHAPAVLPFRVARPRRRPLLWSVVGASAVAATVALVALPGGGPSTRAPSTEAGPGTSALDGRHVLLAAADVAAHGTATTGAYWTTRSITTQTWTVDGGYRVVARTLLQTWVSRDGSGTWLGHQDLGAAPATPGDREKWQRAGSPHSFTVPASSEAGAMRLDTEAGALGVTHLRGGLPSALNFGGCDFTPAQSLALPGDQKGLAAKLSACAALGEKVPMPSGTRTLHPPLWNGLVNMLGSWPISPATRASAYRLLAAQADVRDLGPATDPLGRSGTLLSVTEGQGAYRIRFIVDAVTGQVLSGDKGPTGAAQQSSASLGGVWTDHVGATAAGS